MNASTIARIFFTMVLLIAFVAIGIAMWKEIKAYFTKKLYQFNKWWKEERDIIWLVKRINTELHRSFGSHSIEISFQLFIHFYETNYRDIEHWGFPEDVFPGGTVDLSDLYKWIKKVRVDNYSEIKNLDFKTEKRYFIYWGSKYAGLTHKIVDGTLKIKPIEYIESQRPEIVFQSRITKIYNDLYDLDTEKSKWILERRKFFNI